jgi:hypothetical protein
LVGEEAVLSYIDATKKGSGTLFQLVSFSERTSGMTFHHKNTPGHIIIEKNLS